jgi:hypothetical protein
MKQIHCLRHLVLCCGLALTVETAQPSDNLPGDARQSSPGFRDLRADTWVAQDALGRVMPTISDTGPVKTGQRCVVGIFYVTWHSDVNAKGTAPYAADVSRVLAADPSARLDAKHPNWKAGSYHWGGA